MTATMPGPAVRPHVPAAGRQPDAETLLIGGIVTASARDAAAVLVMIESGDMASSAHATVLEAARRTLASRPETFGPVGVLDDITRHGSRPEVRRVLASAVSSGAGNSADLLKCYAAVVVSNRLRRQVDSLGHALIELAADGAEGVLAIRSSAAVVAIRKTELRLLELRGGTL